MDRPALHGRAQLARLRVGGLSFGQLRARLASEATGVTARFRIGGPVPVAVALEGGWVGARSLVMQRLSIRYPHTRWHLVGDAEVRFMTGGHWLTIEHLQLGARRQRLRVTAVAGGEGEPRLHLVIEDGRPTSVPTTLWRPGKGWARTVFDADVTVRAGSAGGVVTMHGPPGGIRATFSLPATPSPPPDAPLQARVTGRGLKLEALARALETPARWGGRASIDVRLGGRAAAPVLRASAMVPDLRFAPANRARGIPLGRLTLTASYQDRHAQSGLRLRGARGGTLEARARARVDLSIAALRRTQPLADTPWMGVPERRCHGSQEPRRATEVPGSRGVRPHPAAVAR